jgi:hypothetical protein
MATSDPLPPEVEALRAALAAWLEEQRYVLPLEWDGRERLLYVGNRRGKTWTRLTLDEIRGAEGPQKALDFAKRVVEDWHRLWADRTVFERLPRVNRADLESYFGLRR